MFQSALFSSKPLRNLSSAVSAQGPQAHTKIQGVQHNPSPSRARPARAEATGHVGIEEAVLVEELAGLRRWPINVCRGIQARPKSGVGTAACRRLPDTDTGHG